MSTLFVCHTIQEFSGTYRYGRMKNTLWQVNMTKAKVFSICVTDFILGIHWFSGYGQFDTAHPPRSNYLRYTRMRAIPKLDCFNQTIPNAQKYLPYIDESDVGEGLYSFLIMLILFGIHVSKYLLDSSLLTTSKSSYCLSWRQWKSSYLGGLLWPG